MWTHRGHDVEGRIKFPEPVSRTTLKVRSARVKETIECRPEDVVVRGIERVCAEASRGPRSRGARMRFIYNTYYSLN